MLHSDSIQSWVGTFTIMGNKTVMLATFWILKAQTVKLWSVNAVAENLIWIFKSVYKLKSWWKLSVKETQKVEEQRNQPADVGDWIASFKMSDDKNVEWDSVYKTLPMLWLRFLKVTQFSILLNPIGI